MDLETVEGEQMMKDIIAQARDIAEAMEKETPVPADEEGQAEVV